MDDRVYISTGRAMGSWRGLSFLPTTSRTSFTASSPKTERFSSVTEAQYHQMRVLWSVIYFMSSKMTYYVSSGTLNLTKPKPFIVMARACLWYWPNTAAKVVGDNWWQPIVRFMTNIACLSAVASPRWIYEHATWKYYIWACNNLTY